MKRLLINFFAEASLGKLQFNREGTFGWVVSGTKDQITPVKSVSPYSDIEAKDVLKLFGLSPLVFKPYGETYETIREIDKIDPSYITHVPVSGEFHFLARDNEILWFKSGAELLDYIAQENKNATKSPINAQPFTGVRKGDRVYSTTADGTPEIFVKQ